MRHNVPLVAIAGSGRLADNVSVCACVQGSQCRLVGFASDDSLVRGLALFAFWQLARLYAQREEEGDEFDSEAAAEGDKELAEIMRSDLL